MNTKHMHEGLEVAYGLHPHFRTGKECVHAIILDLKGQKYENQDPVAWCHKQSRIAIAVYNPSADSWEPRVVSPGDLPGLWQQYLENQRTRKAKDAVTRSCREFWSERADEVKKELSDLGLAKFSIDTWHGIVKIPVHEVEILLEKVRKAS